MKLLLHGAFPVAGERQFNLLWDWNPWKPSSFCLPWLHTHWTRQQFHELLKHIIRQNLMRRKQMPPLIFFLTCCLHLIWVLCPWKSITIVHQVYGLCQLENSRDLKIKLTMPILKVVLLKKINCQLSSQTDFLWGIKLKVLRCLVLIFS